MTLTTTFTLLRQHDACTKGYKKLAKHVGGVTKYGANTPIDLLTVLDSNGLTDTLWTLRATQQPEAALDVARRLTLDFATHVLPVFEARYPADLRPRKAIQRAVKLRTAYAAAYAADDAYAAYADVSAYADDERKWQAERFAQYLRGENPELLALPERRAT